jgi:hypothetical protein
MLIYSTCTYFIIVSFLFIILIVLISFFFLPVMHPQGDSHDGLYWMKLASIKFFLQWWSNQDTPWCGFMVMNFSRNKLSNRFHSKNCRPLITCMCAIWNLEMYKNSDHSQNMKNSFIEFFVMDLNMKQIHVFQSLMTSLWPRHESYKEVWRWRWWD